MNCKANCSNTNLCEHGYCPPHQYSYCHCVEKKSPLSADQQVHLDSIIKEFRESVTTKYIKGQQEHGGNLWLKSGLIEMALEEVYDMAVYLITLREQLKDHFAESSEKFLINKGG